MMQFHRIVLLAIVLLTSCGGSARVPPLPTAYVRPASPRPVLVVHVATRAPATPQPSPPPTPVAPRTQSPLDQYRAWMEEARALHPYGESVDLMWQVMLCESSGDPNVMGAYHHGLFQYDPNTWAGDWNPYRDQPILDPRAQIFATAKAWHDGNQAWWECY